MCVTCENQTPQKTGCTGRVNIFAFHETPAEFLISTRMMS